MPARRFPPPWAVEVMRLSSYQLISTPIIGRRWRNPIAFGSHALSVHGVISRLQWATSSSGISRSHCTACNQTSTSANCSARPNMSRRWSERSTCQSAECGANDSGTNRSVIRRLAGGLVSYRLLSGSLAVLIVSLERLIRLVRAGHCREWWSGWTVVGASPQCERKSAHQRESERFFEHHLTPDLCPRRHSNSIPDESWRDSEY